VIDSYDALVDLLESIEHFLGRLDIYTQIPPSPAMDEMMVKIIVELISTLAVATRELKQGRTSKSILVGVLAFIQCTAVKFVKKVFGEKDVEAVLRRLDRLTHDEARATAAQTLEVVHGLVQGMRVVIDGIDGIRGKRTCSDCNLPSRISSFLDVKVSLGGVRESLGTSPSDELIPCLIERQKSYIKLRATCTC
jgi:hypothetical protein